MAVHLATKLFAMRKPGRKSRRRDPNAFGAVCNNSGVERVALRCVALLACSDVDGKELVLVEFRREGPLHLN